MEKKSRDRNRNVQSYNHFCHDNGGSAIVMVLVAIAFVGIVASMLLYVTFLNYRMKVVDRHAKDNFYTAETAMAEIKAGLQREVSEAFSTAYMGVLEDYRQGQSDEERKRRFSNAYTEALQEALQEAVNPEKYDLDLLRSFLTVPQLDADGPGAAVTAADDNNKLERYNDGVRLQDVTVTYTDKDGYVAIISTDIWLKVPELGLGNSFVFPKMLDFCLIAREEMRVQGVNTIQGSFYGGQQGISLAAGAGLKVEPYAPEVKVNVITDGDVTIGVPKGEQGNPGGAASFSTAGNVSLWASGIVVNGGSDSYKTTLNGSSYLQDDFTIQGKGSQIKIVGDYFGYGNKTSKAEDSSSILINGIQTTLDMSQCKRLVLAGNAYIGTSGIHAEDDKGQALEENKDIKLGSSVASKAEQLAYLVPAECIGWDVKAGTALVGKNPVEVSSKEYQDFLQAKEKNPKDYEEVNLSHIHKILKKSLANYGAGYEMVYYRAGEGSLWAYYYLKFSSTTNANKFFRDYFAAAPETLTPYIKNYIASFTVNPGLLNGTGGDGFRLNLAGNLVHGSRGAAEDGSDASYSLVEATKTNSAAEEADLSREYTEYSNQFVSLCKKLTGDYGSLTAKERNSNVYDNIINTESVKKYTTVNTIFTNARSGEQALLIREGSSLTSLSEIYADGTLGCNPDKLHLIVTEKDITADKSFQGLIISKGTITVKNTVTLTTDPEIQKTFLAEHTDGLGNKTRALGLFKDGEDATIAEDGTITDDKVITAANLITYENWTKK